LENNITVLIYEDSLEDLIEVEVSPGVFKSLCTITKIAKMPFSHFAKTVAQYQGRTEAESYMTYATRGLGEELDDNFPCFSHRVEVETVSICLPNIRVQRELLTLKFDSV
jgi:hypothetical protein